MKISQRGIDLIKQFEGCRLTAYKDPAGIQTKIVTDGQGFAKS